ncbi:TIGR00153 family protein [Piscirickettsia litoralis]|uniref:TIGR00153 family protein n=1 Tax=Piscirickettsia litoralis TaxID=1891921 RepID=A0ABX3A7I2_9GAMM|nr:TIGR00153 family protein [Piscirickettsia litoralis]ODN43390.1 TIGR00153 family protein [Piscirickettsia litoralis]
MPSTPLLNMFRRSPFLPLQEHMEQVANISPLIIEFCGFAFSQDWDNAEQLKDKILSNDKQADELLRDIRTHMPKGLFLPVARTDLLDLIKTQDKIIDKNKDILSLIFNRKMQLPEPVTNLYLEFLTHSLAAVEQAHAVIRELDDLMETGFTKHESNIVEKMVTDLDHTEAHARELYEQASLALLKLENDLPPVNTMFIYKLFDYTIDIAHLARNVGAKLEVLFAH